MALTSTDCDAYYRVYKALHLVTHEAIPCVENCLQVWHTTQRQTLQPCTTGLCPDSRKPKRPASCVNCMAWGNAVEVELYQPPTLPPATGPAPGSALPPQQPLQQAKQQLSWPNVRQSQLSTSHVEVAKAFVLRLPNKPKTTTSSAGPQYNSTSDFDSASLLMIMAKFKQFHQGDYNSYEIIKKVGGTRNELSHMGLKEDMRIPDQTVKDYFQDMDDFITCLEKLHPQHFISAKDIKAKLNDIQMEPVTAKMKADMNLQISQDLQSVTQKTDLVKEEVDDLREIVNKMKDKVQTTDQIRAQCQSQLQADYITNRGGIGFLPGMPNEFPLDDFFVDLTLVKEEKRPTWVKEKQLSCYTDLLTLKSHSGRTLDHILIRGEAGSGKTTLVNKLAYQWATELPVTIDDDQCEETQCPLNRFHLVFVLDIRKMEPTMDLEDCIKDQLLPDVSKSALKSLVHDNNARCLFLFDGYDELKSHQEVLKSKILLLSCVIVTTRPDTVDEFCQNHNGYVHVRNSGLSPKSSKAFISKYFDVASNERVMQKKNMNQVEKLLDKIKWSYLNALASYPLLLAMMCFIWNETGDIPMRMTSLYKHVVKAFAFQSYSRRFRGKSISHRADPDVDRVFLQLGPASLDGLLHDDIKLIFDEEDLKKHSRTQYSTGSWLLVVVASVFSSIGLEIGLRMGSIGLGVLIILLGLGLGCVLLSLYEVDVIDEAVKLGMLTTVHGKRKGLHMVPQYSFLHRTFQEFCAASYWASLIDVDSERFNQYLRCINQNNVYGMQNMLRFCCGLSSKAAATILRYLVRTCDLVWQLPVALLFEAEFDSKVQPGLHEILEPVKKISLTGRLPGSVLELYAMLNHYSDLGKDQRVQTWLTNIEEIKLSVSYEEVYQFLLNTSGSSTSLMSLKSLSLTYFSSKYDKIVTSFLKQHLQLRHLELEVPAYFPLSFDNDTPQTPVESLYRELLHIPITASHTYFEILIPHLESLSLESTNMDSGLWKRLFDIFIAAGKKLQETSVHSSVASDMKVKSLPMRSLNLSHNDVFTNMTTRNDEEDTALVCRFAEAIEYMSGMQKLDLNGTGLKTTDFGIVSPAMSRMSSLEKLTINMGGKEFRQCLQELRNVTCLDLKSGILNDDDVRLLPLQYLTQLEKLNLSRNRFGSPGLIALSSSFKHINMLQVLDLNGNEMCEEGATALSESLCHIQLLTQLKITLANTASYVALSRGFCHTPNLEELCFLTVSKRDAVISVKAADTLYKSLTHLPKLDVLNHPPFAVQSFTSSDVNSEIVLACYQEIPDFSTPRYPCCFVRSEILSIVNIVERYSGKSISWQIDLPFSLEDVQ